MTDIRPGGRTLYYKPGFNAAMFTGYGGAIIGCALVWYGIFNAF